MFLSRLNEISGGCEKILPVSASCFNVLMSKVKKYNYYMPAGSKTNLGGSCIYYKE